jgi:hypothetical protein
MSILKTGKYIILIIVLQLLLAHQSTSAQDTTLVSDNSKQPRKYVPMRATMMGAAFPGFGQIYNRKYWKIPVVYAGFAALGYAVVYNSTNYITYTKGYQDFIDLIPETDSYLELIKGVDPARYDPVLYPESYNVSDEAWVKDHLLRGTDYYKKYRDLSFIGIAAWYLITILDANVDASLSDYDIGENLNLTFGPASVPGYYFTGVGFNISFKINF